MSDLAIPDNASDLAPDLAALADHLRALPGVRAKADIGLVAANGGTYSIQSVAHLREGRTAGIRAVIRTGGNGAPGSAYTALDWQEGTTAR